MKDWGGNTNSVFKTLGASSHCKHERPKDDYFATEPKAVRFLLELENFEGDIWECCAGEGHLSEEIKKFGYKVFSSDKIDRGYGKVVDFLKLPNDVETHMNIITNPPYKFANEIITKALEIMQENKKLALFLPIRYLEGKTRKQIFLKNPPKTVYVSSSRLKCALNGDFANMKESAVSYSWIVWEKQNVYEKDHVTQLKWFN